MAHSRKATLGLRAHSGWAVLVAVSERSAILRRRIEMPGESKQPYHAAETMEVAEAQAWIQRTEQASVRMAAAAIEGAVATLGGEGYRIGQAAVLLGSGKPLPELSKILAAHPLIHTAEGVFFRDVLRRACEGCGLRVRGIREREAIEQCASTLRLSTEDTQARLAAMGKAIGPPWTQDEKLSAAAALTIGGTASGRRVREL